MATNIGVGTLSNRTSSGEQTTASTGYVKDVIANWTTLTSDFKTLVTDAAEILRNEVDLEEIRSVGVNTDPLEYDFVYGYPPIALLPPIETPDHLIRRKVPTRLALYVHIPFCNCSCSFCYLAKRTGSSNILIQKYLDLLAREVQIASLWADGVPIDSVYFGGGTPTCLETGQLLRLADLVRSRFTLAEDYEWTIEASPDTINFDKARDIVDAGVNRISVGVQSFDENRLRDLSRGHSSQQAWKAIRSILDSGVKYHNIDMIYGFPGQTPDDLWVEFQAISSLRPRSVTWYQLWQHMDTPLRRQELKERRMTDRAMLDIKCFVREAMVAMGYQRDKVDWFVRDIAFAPRQQEHKWSGGDFLGLGLSAYGYLNGFYYQNHQDWQYYEKAICEFGWSVNRGIQLTPDQIIRRNLMLGIKRRNGVHKTMFKLASVAQRKTLISRIQTLSAAGLLRIEGNRVCLSRIGELYGDCVSNALGLTRNDETASAKWRHY